MIVLKYNYELKVTAYEKRFPFEMESSSKPRAMDDPGGSVNGIGGSGSP